MPPDGKASIPGGEALPRFNCSVDHLHDGASEEFPFLKDEAVIIL
jgi:hypothetical protein